MNILTEKHGYIDPDSILLDKITDKVYDIIINDKGFINSYSYIYNGKKYTIENIDGVLFSKFTVNLKHNKLKQLNVIVVKITDEDIVTDKDFIKFTGDSPTFGYFQTSLNDNIGYIYISYDAHIVLPDNHIKSEIKNTIYHEIRHYFDEVVGVIPRTHKNTSADIPHYIEEIANEVLDINYTTNKTQLRDSKNKGLTRLLYMLNPTEINAFYHSFVVTLQEYKQEHPNCTYNDIIKYIKQLETEDDNTAFIYNHYSIFFSTYDKYKKVIDSLCNNVDDYVFYFVITFKQIKTTNEYVTKQNKIISNKFLNGETVYGSDMSDKQAEQIIRDYINEYYIKFVYYHIHKYIFNVVKNINKLIADLTN